MVGGGGEQRAGQVRHQQALQHRVVEGEDQQKDDFATGGEGDFFAFIFTRKALDSQYQLNVQFLD